MGRCELLSIPEANEHRFMNGAYHRAGITNTDMDRVHRAVRNTVTGQLVSAPANSRTKMFFVFYLRFLYHFHIVIIFS